MSATAEIDMEAGEREAAVRAELEGGGTARWIVQPIIAVALVAGVLIYTRVGGLSANQKQSLEVDHLLELLRRHMWISLLATVLVCAIAIPLGILLTRGGMRRYTNPILAVAGFGQATPVIGLITIAWFILGTDASFEAAILSLTIYGILPIVANTVAGLNGVDERVIEASRGMGMSAGATLLRVELPLALPVIIAGARTALVLMVGAASLVALIGAGGLGEPIDIGIKRQQDPVLVCGALLVVALALVVDWLVHLVEMIASPKGV